MPPAAARLAPATCASGLGAAARERRNAGEAPIFGVLDLGGRVAIGRVEGLTAEGLLQSDIRIVKRGAIFFADRFGKYEALIFGGSRRLGAKLARRVAEGKIAIDRAEGFWAFAGERLRKLRHISQPSFALYLEELAFRYNHRAQPLFEPVVDRLVRPVPKLLIDA